MFSQLSKLKSLVRCLAIVELRTNFPYMRMSRARLALSGLALLLLTALLVQAIYLPLRAATTFLIDGGQVQIATIVDIRLFIVFVIGASLALYILVHRFFWDTEIQYLSCLPIPTHAVLVGLAARSAITLGIISVYLAMYLVALAPGNHQALFIAASLVSLLIVLVMAFLVVLLGVGVLWPVLGRLGKPWLYAIQLAGTAVGLLGMAGVQVLESLFAQDLVKTYNSCSMYRHLVPTFPVSEFLLSVTQGRFIRSAAFLSLSLLIVIGMACVAYATSVRRLETAFDDGPARSIRIHFPLLRDIWRYLPIPRKPRQLVAKDLGCLVRSGRFAVETAVCCIAAGGFMYLVSRLGQGPRTAGILDLAPILLGAIVPVCMARSASAGLVWGDRKLGYLLRSAFERHSLLNWKWATGFATVFGRSVFVICFSQVLSSAVSHSGLRSLPWSLAITLASSAFSSIHGLSISIRRLRPDVPRLTLAGATESIVVTLGGISIIMMSFVVWNLLGGNPVAQACVLLPTGVLCLVSYVRAASGLKEFGRE